MDSVAQVPGTMNLNAVDRWGCATMAHTTDYRTTESTNTIYFGRIRMHSLMRPKELLYVALSKLDPV